MKFASQITEFLFSREENFGKFSSCWDYVKKLFLQNCKKGIQVSICFLIDPYGKNTVAVNIGENLGEEIETEFSKKEILEIKPIAEANGLLASTFSSDDENDFEFLELTYTAPDFEEENL